MSSSPRGALFLVAVLAFSRAIQTGWDMPLIDWFNSLPVERKLVAAAVLVGAITGVVVYFYRPSTLLFLYLSIASAILSGVFIAQVGLDRSSSKGDPANALSSPRVSITERAPVFLLVFDGLGADVLLKDEQIDPNRFPRLAALGRDGAVFSNARSNYLDSLYSIRSFMGGTFIPDDLSWVGGVPGAHPNGLLSILREAGYGIEFNSDGFQCTDEGYACNGIRTVVGKNVHLAARDFISRIIPNLVTLRVSFLPTLSVHTYNKPVWNEFLDRITATETPGKAYFLHLLLPHRPYTFDRVGNQVRSLNTDEGFDDLVQMAGYYEEQVTFVDFLIGEFVARLKAAKLYDRSLIIVTADHGPRSLGLGQGYGGLGNMNSLPDELSEIIPRVPLIIRGPDVPTQVSGVDYQHIDFLPTVLDILKLPAPQDLQGVSAFSPNRPSRDKVIYGFLQNDGVAEKVSYVYASGRGRWRRVGP